MRADNQTPESRYPLPVLSVDAFHHWSKLDEVKYGSLTDSIEIISSREQFQQLQAIANFDGVGVMDEVRGAMMPYLDMWFDRSKYYDIPLVNKLPKGNDRVRFPGRLPMTQLWRIAALTGLQTKGYQDRMRRIIYSANDLYVQRRFEDKATYGCYLLHLLDVERSTARINSFSQDRSPDTRT